MNVAMGWLTTGQAARLTGVHRDTILRWIKAGKLDAWRTPGGRYKVRESDVLDVLGHRQFPGVVDHAGD